jgi:hypothetical protein
MGKQDEKRVAAKPVKQAAMLAQAPAALGRRQSKPMQMVALPKPERGVVIDFQTLTSSTNFTFQSDSTYFVDGTFGLSGTTTIEGGTVIKYSSGSSIITAGPIICRTDAYRPAVFTAKDDNTVGETISGSSGVPSGYYAFFALECDSASMVLDHLRISHAEFGLLLAAGGEHTVRHSQILNSSGAVYSWSTLTLQNVLIDRVSDSAIGGTDVTVRGEHLTVHRVNNFAYGVTLSLTNSILSAVTNWGVSFVSNSNVTNSNDAGVFQTVGAGAHYLIDSSPYRDVGTTNIDQTLLAELRRRTTYPPLVIAPTGYYGVSQTLFPRAGRDTDLPDLGYHYDALDYAISYVFLTNATIQVDPGTAIAVFNSTNTSGYGFAFGDGAKLLCNGRADSKITFTHYSTVQEMANTNWNGPIYALLMPVSNPTDSPELRCRFTDFTVLEVQMPILASFDLRTHLINKSCTLHEFV